MTARTARHAFTLLELAMALAAVAIVAAYALPSWSGRIARSHRIEAMAALYRAAQFVDAQPQVPATLSAGMDQAPQNGPPVYHLRLLPADEANGGYGLEAAPVATGPMRDDACGAFTLDATGARANRTVTGEAPGQETEDCWRGR
jgi:type IV pilus assembly protein PilE